MANANFSLFSRADIQQLVSEYPDDNLSVSGQADLISRVLGQSSPNSKSIVAVMWQLGELMADLVFVVDPLTTTPWYLHLVLTQDTLFLALHKLRLDAAPATFGAYLDALLPSFATDPLSAGVLAIHTHASEQWLEIKDDLSDRLGSEQGQVDPTVPCQPVMPASLATGSVPVDTQDVADRKRRPCEEDGVSQTPADLAPKKGKRRAEEPAPEDELRGKLSWGTPVPKDKEQEEMPRGPSTPHDQGPSTPRPIVLRDGSVIRPAWSATFGPPPGAPRGRKWR
ncbi:Uncharacterized protein PECH_001425 [Penicillium ucsense]|uniref:Uncharacterized protein n=1 Tax=Penicillium ucsense TaxID=2839758 RepID=A0A8J8W091_9EURO|nr:Uncharacterized protein PECM_007100 [Penicillium ucsense]KAF7738198.1 Uncharacterized protein PECH_001425 [Penicillium ucsense]